MGTNTGLGIGIGIPFKNNALGGDKPYFPPELKARMIGVWTNYGKKNTDADRNIIKNKIPNAGGDLEILNAAYKLNSGFGKYSEDFTTWTKSSKITSVDSESFDFVTNVNWNLLYYKSNIGKDIPSFKVHIKLKGEGKIFYNYITSEGVFTNKVITSEEYVVPISYNTKYTGETPVNCGFTIGISNECSGTITQIPNFEDAFVTDGINDMIVSQKTLQEMGVTKGLTIVSMIHQINTNESNFITTNNLRTVDKVVGRNIVSNIDKTGIYGWYKENIEEGNIGVINNILGDKADYIAHNSPNTNTNPITNSKFYVTGYAVENGFIELSSVAYYWTFAVLGKATEDEINLIIGNYNLDRSLKPDILCNIGKQGITNDNHADFNDKLIDYSGNGRDIQMYNLAWKGGSGIAAKQYETFKDWLNETSSTSIITQIDEFTRIVESTTNGYWVSRIRRDSDLDKVYDPINVYLYQDNNFLVHECKYEVDGVKYSIPINEPVGKGYHKLEIYTKDRYTELPENAEKVVLSEWYFPKSNKSSIKYSVIPSHKGGILLDGITDFGKVTGMPIYKDYTFIIDREIISIGNTAGIVASKSEDSTDVNKQGAFLFEYLGAPNNISAWSFYKDNGKVANTDFTRGISYQSKYSYNGIELLAGTALDSDKLWLGILRDSRFANVAIYSLMSFPYSMSEFLIERQLKKHKLGTLYPDMVEFRPIVKSNNKWNIIEIWQRDKLLYRHAINDNKTGIYLKKDSTIGIYVKPYVGQKVSEIVYNGVSYTDLKLTSNGLYYKVVPITKSPQKITMTIEQDENYVQWNPTVESNVGYSTIGYLNYSHNIATIKVGDYISIGDTVAIRVILGNTVDEVVNCKVNGQECEIVYVSSKVFDCKFTITSEFPQKINITIDEYIRYEDIVQPYPLFFEFTDENGNLISWGGKAKVGSTITRTKGLNYANLLEGLFTITNPRLNGVPLASSQHVVEKSMVFTCTATWAFDNNEPKCILSPRLLRIPNSSYKILGYIPDISGHGNHGKINNSAYAEGSGVNEDGSYQFDGVDDFVTIPTIVGGKQVLMKVNWQSNIGDAILYDQRFNVYNYEFAIYNSNTDNYSENPHAYSSRNNGKTYIDGILNTYIKSAELQNVTHNITATNELSSGSIPASPIIGSNISHDTAFAQMTLYDFMLFDEISTEAKIKELNTYIGITPKVTLPNYYWDNYGKKNTDANRGHVDEQVSLQKTGTSVNPLENFNISYEGMSGYNGYPVVFGASKTWESLSGVYGYTSNVTNTTIHVTHAEHAGHGLLFSYVKKDGALANIKEIPAFRVTIGGLEGNSKFGYRYLATEDATEETLVYLGNGTHELAKSFAPTEALLDLTRNVWVGIFITPMIEGEVVFDCDITIEVLPEYENGLAYDGVSDFSQNTEIEVVEDFTFLVKGSLLKGLTGSGGCIARKGDKKHYDTGGYAFIYCFDSPIESYRNSYYSFGKSFVPSKEIVAPPLIGYMTKTNVNGETTTFGTNSDIKGIIFGNWSSGYMNMVIYKSIFYTKTISLLEINFLKNLMEKNEIIDINHPIFISNTEDESNTSQDT